MENNDVLLRDDKGKTVRIVGTDKKSARVTILSEICQRLATALGA